MAYLSIAGEESAVVEDVEVIDRCVVERGGSADVSVAVVSRGVVVFVEDSVGTKPDVGTKGCLCAGEPECLNIKAQLGFLQIAEAT